ncbi:MAG: DUF4258 domain-containing protein [Peptococcaceae bacterium]|nr:DUF4258 domain-containing protein [Candidatus Syntrophopropionicum ammoniitolerans]
MQLTSRPEAWLELLRKAGKTRSYIISKHAFNRMGERTISDDDVHRCSLEGHYIECQGHGQDLKVVLQGECEDGSVFYMVVALAFPRPVIVTVCRFKAEIWDDKGPMKKRK